MSNENKIAHLGFIQGVINRVGNNSFLIKGWAITLIAAIFALSAESANKNFSYLVLLPLIFFWWLDTFFLYQEKLYRKLYEKVASGAEQSNEFSMNAYKYSSEVRSFGRILVSTSLRNFYGPLLFMIGIGMWKVLNVPIPAL